MAEARPPEEDLAHDVLAAEEFAVPGPDPALHPPPVVLPEDPTGISAPHDVLAAEEFAMPAVVETKRRSVAESPHWAKLGAAAALLAVLGVRRRRRR
jgi:hypothetical protein